MIVRALESRPEGIRSMLDETTTGPEARAPRSSGPRSWCSSASGSVPATLIVNGDAPFTMADLGMISLAFGTIVDRHRLRPRARRRQPHQPGRHPRARRHRQVPVERGARLHRRAGRRRHPRRGRDHRRARPEGQRRRPRRRVVRPASASGTAGVHAPSSSARSSWCSRSSASSTARPRPASPAWRSASSCSPRSSRSPRRPAPRSTRPAPSARCSSSRSPAAT